jgi:tetratricopeptide (TPR) repeat protein
VEEDWQALWPRREELKAAAGRWPDGQKGQREQAENDLLDLALLWTDLRVRQAAEKERPRARREALGVLDEAEALFGPRAVLAAERRRLAGTAGPVDAPQPRSAWEHYVLGRRSLRDGRLEEAAPHLDRAARARPDLFWPNFYWGLCAHRLGQHPDAVSAFSACLALAPSNGGCYYNRALAYDAAGQDDRAEEDYTRALDRQPTLGGAWLNRGVLRYRKKNHAGAKADLLEAERNHVNPVKVDYNRALVHAACKEYPEARECLTRVLEKEKDHKEARELLKGLPP